MEEIFIHSLTTSMHMTYHLQISIKPEDHGWQHWMPQTMNKMALLNSQIKDDPDEIEWNDQIFHWRANGLTSLNGILVEWLISLLDISTKDNKMSEISRNYTMHNLKDNRQFHNLRKNVELHCIFWVVFHERVLLCTACTSNNTNAIGWRDN
jgi:hypothetical protein